MESDYIFSGKGVVYAPILILVKLLMNINFAASRNSWYLYQHTCKVSKLSSQYLT